MQKFKLSKQDEKDLQQLVKILPATENVGHIVHLSGSEILSNPKITTPDRNAIDPEEIYPVRKMTGTRSVNHFKRLKQAYEQGGKPAVDKYMEPYLKKAAENE